MPEETQRKQNPRSPRVELQDGSAVKNSEKANRSTTRPCHATLGLRGDLHILLHRHSLRYVHARPSHHSPEMETANVSTEMEDGEKSCTSGLGAFPGVHKRDTQKGQ